MALTRSFLKGMGLTEEQVSAIVESHSESLNGLKERVKALEGELSEAQESARNNAEHSESEYKAKYEEEHSAFEKYKLDQAKELEHSTKKRAYEKALREVGVSDKRISQILAIAKVDELKLNKDGELENVKELQDKIKYEWSEFIPSVVTKTDNPETPPTSSGNVMTKSDILEIKDATERQKAMAEHIDLFK